MKLHLIKLNPPNSNIYLIDKDILIDAGCGLKEQKEILEDKLKQCGSGFDKIKIILLTHCHFDHTNGTSFFKKAKIYISCEDGDALKKKDNETICSSYFDQTYTGRSDIHLLLKKGAILPLKYDFTIHVIETPGHTRGSMCFYDKKRKAIFSGDTLFKNGYGRVDLPGGSMKDMRESIQKLQKIDINIIYPGHGEIFEKEKNTFKKLKIY